MQAYKFQSAIRNTPWAHVIACLGFGCMFAVCPFSSLATTAMLQSGMNWQEILFGRMLYTAVGAVGFLLRDTLARGFPDTCTATHRVIAGGVVAGISIALTFISGTLVPRWLLATAYGTISGVGLALLIDTWVRAFLSVRKAHGRQACIAALASSFLLTVILTWAANHMGAISLNLLAVMEVLLALGCTLLVLSTQSSYENSTDKTLQRNDFIPSRSVRKLLPTLGFLWGLGYNMPTDMGYGALLDLSFPLWIITLVSCGALLVGVMALARTVKIDTVHFGLMLRWLVAFSGVIWAFEPLLVVRVSSIANILFIAAFWIQLMGLFILVIEVSLESSLPLQQILSRYFSLFVAGSCAGAVVFLLARMLCTDPVDAYALMAAIGSSVSLLLMPFMPSRGSNARVLTLESLPEDDGSLVFNEQSRLEFAKRHSLTHREVQVFNLLLLGLGRDAIAQQLAISPLTAKNHIHTIYSKTGVHSTRELMALVYGVSK